MTDAAANFRRIPLEVFNEGKVELADELLTEDFIEHLPLPPGFPTGRASLGAFVTALLAAFPDFKYEIVGQWQDGETHIGYVRATATMTGDFMGMPASGKSATWDEIHIGRYTADGLLAEHWGIVDQLGMLTQLGFVPPMGG